MSPPILLPRTRIALTQARTCAYFSERKPSRGNGAGAPRELHLITLPLILPVFSILARRHRYAVTALEIVGRPGRAMPKDLQLEVSDTLHGPWRVIKAFLSGAAEAGTESVESSSPFPQYVVVRHDLLPNLVHRAIDFLPGRLILSPAPANELAALSIRHKRAPQSLKAVSFTPCPLQGAHICPTSMHRASCTPK